MTTYEALIEALVLAVTAPEDEKSQACVEMAERFASHLTPDEVFSAQAEAIKQLELTATGGKS